MYPLVRTAKVALAALAGKPLELAGTSRIELRVWPGDLDLYLHLNNGRYLSLMDLGRLDYIIRVGLLPLMRRKGWRPLLAAATTRFWRSLKPFNRFTMETKVVWWDEKWIYLQQEMLYRGEVAAPGHDEDGDQVAPGHHRPAPGRPALGAGAPPAPVPPPGLAAWIKWEQEIKNGSAAPGVTPGA